MRTELLSRNLLSMIKITDVENVDTEVLPGIILRHEKPILSQVDVESIRYIFVKPDAENNLCLDVKISTDHKLINFHEKKIIIPSTEKENSELLANIKEHGIYIVVFSNDEFEARIAIEYRTGEAPVKVFSYRILH